MRADGESHRRWFILCGAFKIDRAHVTRRNQVDAGLSRPAQHDAATADIGESGSGDQRIIDAAGNIRCPIFGMLQMRGQCAEVGFVVFEDDLLNRRLLRRYS